MKSVFTSFILCIMANFSIAQNSQREPTLLSLSKNTYLSTMIAKPLIENKCEQYEKSNILDVLAKTFLDPLIKFQCEKVTSDLFLILDIKTLQDNQGYMGRAIFTSKLIELLNRTQTEKILAQLAKSLKQVVPPNDPFNLIKLLMDAPISLSQEKAVEFIAVLFQDTNAAQHIYFLELLKLQENWDEKSLKNKNLNILKTLVFKFQEMFHDFHDIGINQFHSKYILLPNYSVSLNRKNFQPALYHFYIPAYLTYRLNSIGHSPYYAFIAPFSLRVIYEQLFNEETSMTNLQTYLIALGQNEPAISSNYKHVDLYLSLAGSYWALNKNLTISYEQFAESVARSMPKTLRLITKNL